MDCGILDVHTVFHLFSTNQNEKRHRPRKSEGNMRNRRKKRLAQFSIRNACQRQHTQNQAQQTHFQLGLHNLMQEMFVIRLVEKLN